MEVEIQKWLFDAHGYDHLDNDIIWGIIEDDLPKLTESIQNASKLKWQNQAVLSILFAPPNRRYTFTMD